MNRNRRLPLLIALVALLVLSLWLPSLAAVTTTREPLPNLKSVTYQVAPEGEMPEVTNTYDDPYNGVDPTYHFVTTDASKAGTTSITHEGKTFTVTTHVMDTYATIDAAVTAALDALPPDATIAQKNAARTAAERQLRTFRNLPGYPGFLPANTTWFFDEGEFWDNSSYTQFSNANVSIVGVKAAEASNDKHAVFRRVPNPGVAVLDQVERHQLYNSPEMYLANIVFDGNGYDMLPERPLYPGNGSRSRGEALIFVGVGSNNLVLKNIEIRNVGKNIQDSGLSVTHNKNVALEVFQSYAGNTDPDTDGPKFFIDVSIHSVRTSYYGVVFTNKANQNYFENLQVDIAETNKTAVGSHGVRIEHNNTSAGHNIPGNSANFYGSNTRVYDSSLGDPEDVSADFIQIQEYQYNDISGPEAYRFVEYRLRPWTASNIGSYRMWKGFRAPYTPHTDYSVPTAILDRNDNYWIVTDNNPNATITQQLDFIRSLRSDTSSGLGDLDLSRIPPVNIKLLAGSDRTLDESFTVPDFGGDTPVNIVLLEDENSLYTTNIVIPTVPGFTADLGSSHANVRLYNFDFDKQAHYTLQEAVSGTMATGEAGAVVPADPYNNSYDKTLTPRLDLTAGEGYSPATRAARVTGSTEATFQNCVFTQLVDDLQREGASINALQNIDLDTLAVGSTLNLGVTAQGSYTSTPPLAAGRIAPNAPGIPEGAGDTNLYYLSSNPDVATVDADGIVTAVAGGVATIYVKAMDQYNDGEIEKPYASFRLNVPLSITATKHWDDSLYDPATMPEPPTANPPNQQYKPLVYMTLYRSATPLQPHLLPDAAPANRAVDINGTVVPVARLRLGNTEAVFNNLPSTYLDGDGVPQPWYYYVRETNQQGTHDYVRNRGYYAKNIDASGTPSALDVTNIYRPTISGDSSTLCQVNWYAESTIDRAVYDHSLNLFTHAVNENPDTFTTPAGVVMPSWGRFEVQHWSWDGRQLSWRVPVATRYELRNARLVIDFKQFPNWELEVPADWTSIFSDTVYGFTGNLYPGYVTRQDIPASSISYADNVLTINIGDMPAMSAYMINLKSTVMDPDTIYAPGHSYRLGATFTADTRCVTGIKVWEGGAPDGTTLTLNLLREGVSPPLADRSALEDLLNTTFPRRTTDDWNALAMWIHQGNERVPGFLSVMNELIGPAVFGAGNPGFDDYTFDQAELNRVMAALTQYYSVQMTTPDDSHTWGRLDWRADYSVDESDLPDGWKQQGKPVLTSDPANQHHGEWTITNISAAPPHSTAAPIPTYPTLRVQLPVSKVLKNGTLKAGDFTFQLKDGSGKLLAEATNAADGSVTFPDRTFSKAVSNYLYTVQEVPGKDAKITYDKTVYTLKVSTKAVEGKLEATIQVEKDGTPYAGKAEFVNIRKVPATGDSILRTLGLALGAATLLLGGAYIMGRKRRQTN